MRRVVRGTAAFAAASVVQRSVGFFLLPLYARVLSPSEYGQIAVITAVAAVVGTIVGLGLETAVLRARVRLADEPLEAHAFVNTVGGFALVVPLLAALALSTFPTSFLAATFEIPGDALRLAFIGTALNVSAAIVPLALLRAQERLGDYLRLTGIQVILMTTLTVTLVVILHWGVMGWMLASALGSCLLLVRGLLVLGHRWSIRFAPHHLQQALVFGLPLVPHMLSHWGLSLSDRAVLGAFVDPAQVGAYYVAYQFGLPISVMAIALSQSVQPLHAEAATSSARRHEIGSVTTHQVLLLGFVASGVAMVGPSIVDVALPSSYADAGRFIPWIALGVLFFGLYLIPMNAVAVMAGHTRWVWAFTFTAAVANVGLNLVLVPQIGAIAAAIDTAIGYGLLLAGVSLYMHRVCDPPIPYEWHRIGLGLAMMAAVVGLAMLFAPLEPLPSLAVRSGAVVLILLMLVVSGLWGGVADRARLVLRNLTTKG